MYQEVGWAGDCPSGFTTLDLPWNPPGWGSVSSVDLAARAAMWLQREVRLAMVVGIRPGGSIPFHVDDPASENGMSGAALERLHVVLTTNPRCWNFHGGVWQQLRAGVMYRMDPTVEHASINFGDAVRLHLVIDIAM